jgi:outer membrane protein assembly factor BamD (BamD/ComL family)
MAKKPATRKRTASKTAKTSRRSSTKKKTAAKPADDPKQLALAKARREAYEAAVRLYERGLESLQHRKFDKATTSFQKLIDDYPEERELHERSRLYLQVCARESQPAPKPQTVEELVYAATLALNSGSLVEALEHLEAAAKQDPASDHVQYMLALARADNGDSEAAATHLLRSIELNPDNRFLARQETSFESLRHNEVIREALRTLPAGSPPQGAGG